MLVRAEVQHLQGYVSTTPDLGYSEHIWRAVADDRMVLSHCGMTGL